MARFEQQTSVATKATGTSSRWEARRPAGPPALGRIRALVAALAVVVSALVMVVGAAPASAVTVTRAYVANQASDTVSVIDTATNTVVATIVVGNDPYDVAVSPAGTRAFVTNAFSGTVSVIDTATNTVVATIPVGDEPVGVAVAQVTIPDPSADLSVTKTCDAGPVTPGSVVNCSVTVTNAGPAQAQNLSVTDDLRGSSWSAPPAAEASPAEWATPSPAPWGRSRPAPRPRSPSSRGSRATSRRAAP